LATQKSTIGACGAAVQPRARLAAAVFEVHAISCTYGCCRHPGTAVGAGVALRKDRAVLEPRDSHIHADRAVRRRLLKEKTMIRFALSYVRSYVRREEGQDLIEYALLAGLVADGAVAILGSLDTGIEGAFQAVIDALP
jgi:Flp pilus assembly pilin Flp